MAEETRLIERMEKGLTTEVDAQQIQELLYSISELVVGMHRLATTALQDLEQGNWRQAIERLERLAVIE